MFSIGNLITAIDGNVGNSSDAYAWMNYNDPHVAISERSVLKSFFKRCKEHRPAMKPDKKLARLNAYRDVILIHRKNIKQYNSVMRGM